MSAIARCPSARRAKERSSDLVWRWTGRLFRCTPARDPRLDAVKRNGLATVQEFVEATPVLCNIRTCEIDNRIEQRHCFGKNTCDALSPLGRHLGQACVGAGVDFQGTANNVHCEKI